MSNHDSDLDLCLSDMETEIQMEMEMIREHERYLQKTNEKKVIKKVETTVEKVETEEEKKNQPSKIISDVEQNDDADDRSIYVGNVDWASQTEELEDHFSQCGSIVRVTIPKCNMTGRQKNYAYIEFAKIGGAENARQLDGSSFRRRLIVVLPKRANVPGISSQTPKVYKEYQSDRGFPRKSPSSHGIFSRHREEFRNGEERKKFTSSKYAHASKDRRERSHYPY